MSCAARQGPRALRGKSVDPFARPLCQVLVPKCACRIWVILGVQRRGPGNGGCQWMFLWKRALKCHDWKLESQDSTSRTNFMGCCKFVTSILVPQAAESLRKVPSPLASHNLASGHCLVASICWAGCHNSSLTCRGWYAMAIHHLLSNYWLPCEAWALEVPKMFVSEVPSVLLKLMLKGRERSADAKRRAPDSSASTLSLWKLSAALPRSSARPWRFHSVFSYAFPADNIGSNWEEVKCSGRSNVQWCQASGRVILWS